MLMFVSWQALPDMEHLELRWNTTQETQNVLVVSPHPAEPVHQAQPSTSGAAEIGLGATSTTTANAGTHFTIHIPAGHPASYGTCCAPCTTHHPISHHTAHTANCLLRTTNSSTCSTCPSISNTIATSCATGCAASTTFTSQNPTPPLTPAQPMIPSAPGNPPSARWEPSPRAAKPSGCATGCTTFQGGRAGIEMEPLWLLTAFTVKQRLPDNGPHACCKHFNVTQMF